jgi:hypothetical protein
MTVDGGLLYTFDGVIEHLDDEGCAFILDGGGRCGAMRRVGSSYCEPHHALCHIAGGSAGERRRLRETEALASAVGGRRGGSERVPPDRFLRRLENVARGYARRKCSCIVLIEDGQ